MRTARAIALATGVALAAACAGTPATQPGTARSVVAQTDPSQEPGAQWFPDIVDATVHPPAHRRTDTVFDVEVTVSSPYDTPERYADGWRVLTLEGTVLGSHTLLHDHAGEQPFTRVQTGLVIPAGVETVVIQGRDLVHGYGGGTVEVAVPGR